MNGLFSSLFNTTGKVLFILGLVLNICMVFFGIWPSLIYLILMFAGIMIIYLSKKNGIEIRTSPALKKNINVFLITLLGSVLIIIAIFMFSGTYRKKNDTITEIKEIQEALTRFKEDTGKYPTDLSALIHGNPLRMEWSRDSWDIPYRYTSSGKHFYMIISEGPDKKFGSQDDLVFRGD
jgi:uncharacterized membrane protein